MPVTTQPWDANAPGRSLDLRQDARAGSCRRELPRPGRGRRVRTQALSRTARRGSCPQPQKPMPVAPAPVAPPPRRRVLHIALLLGLGVGSFVAAYGLTKFRSARQSSAPPPGMRWVPSGEFTMGSDSDQAWPDERPAHRVRVDGFWIDEHEVTNAEFAKLVAATGYVTTAE